MKIRFLGKNAQEASGLTWIVATLIIVFLLIVYLTLTLFLSELSFFKNIFSDNEIQKTQASSNLVLAETLNAFLRTDVKYHGKAIKVSDFIEQSVDFYIGQSELMMEPLGWDINNLEQRYNWATTSSEFLLNPGAKDAKEKSEFIFQEIKIVFNPLCADYIVRVPQGYVRKDSAGFESSKAKFQDISGEEASSWTGWTYMPVYYKGQKINIGYRRLLTC